jgi:hypothetical protein
MSQIRFSGFTVATNKLLADPLRRRRSNRWIDKKLREAYQKYDQSAETRSLLERYLIEITGPMKLNPRNQERRSAGAAEN